MSKIHVRSGRLAAFTLALLVAGFGVTSCGGEVDDPADPGDLAEVEPGAGPSALNPGVCAAVARDGKVDICHANDQAVLLHEALTVPTESCSDTHARHPDDFLADPDVGCLVAKKCKGPDKPCKLRPGECCNTCLCEGRNCRCT